MRSFSYAPPGATEELGRLWARSAANDLLAHGTGAWPWAAGVSAAELALSRPDLFADRRVLELGCGCGLAGVALALAQPPPASVTLTDANAAAVANARRNLEANGARAEVLELAWEEVTPARAAALRPNLVIAADVIYDPEAIPALVGALRNLLRAAGDGDAFALFLVTPRQPASQACFLDTCAASHLSVQDATEELLHGGGAMPVGFEHLPAAVAEERRRVRAYRILSRASE
jgi:predicted nicotinamide N-methyase